VRQDYWTEEEDAILRQAVQIYGEVILFFFYFSYMLILLSIYLRYSRSMKYSKNLLLIFLFEGTKNWQHVSSTLPGRVAEQCLFR